MWRAAANIETVAGADGPSRLALSWDGLLEGDEAMRKALALLVVIGVAVAAVWMVRGPAAGGPEEAGPPGPSAALQHYLSDPYSTLNLSATEIHTYADFEMKYGRFGAKGLKYVVDPDVTGKIMVQGHDVTWASVLDRFCRENGCRWEVVGADTIRIRTAEGEEVE